jgi:hypothetical protein
VEVLVTELGLDPAVAVDIVIVAGLPDTVKLSQKRTLGKSRKARAINTLVVVINLNIKKILKFLIYLGNLFFLAGCSLLFKGFKLNVA